jgi:hypothetical protein
MEMEKIRTIIPKTITELGMQNQVRWGIALIIIGILLALLVPFFGIPLAVIGAALLIWRGREENIEPIKE